MEKEKGLMPKVLDSAFLAKCNVFLENAILFIPEIPHLIGEKKSNTRYVTALVSRLFHILKTRQDFEGNKEHPNNKNYSIAREW